MAARARVAIMFLLALLMPRPGQSADWTLTHDELVQLQEGAVLVDAGLTDGRSAEDARAAVQVRATPGQVFRTLTSCAEALKFVPHLEHCTVLETATDGSWQIVEQVVYYAWYMPRARYVFRARYEGFDRITFSNVRGDFRENRGEWDFEPLPGGAGTIVRYRVHLVPRFFVPRWLMRSMLKRDLPQLMQGLRRQAESGAAQAGR